METPSTPLPSTADARKVVDRVLLSTRAARIGTWDLDVRARQVSCDDIFRTLHGLTTGDDVNVRQALMASLHPDDRRPIARELLHAIRGEKEFDTEYRVMWADGTLRYIRSRAMVQRDASDGSLRILGTNWDDTKSKVAEQKVQALHRELSIFLDTINEIFFSIDMINGKVIRISEACASLYGYTPADFYSNHLLWLEIVHPDDMHIIDREDGMLHAGKQVYNQKRIICRDRSVKWIETRIVPTLDDRGKLTRVDGVSRDITETRKAEEELHENRERYRKIVETAQEGIWMIDKDNRTVFVNRAMSDMLGYSPEEMTGKLNLEFKDEEGKALALAQIERRKQGINETHDAVFIAKSVKRVWGSVSTNPLYDEHGNYNGALAMITDITQRKLDEEALKSSEANLKTIINNTSVIYIQMDADFIVVSFNEPARNLVRTFYGRELAVGTYSLDYYPDDRKPAIRDIMDRLRRGEIIEYEISYADGPTNRWYTVKYTPIFDDERRALGYILSLTNITESKLAAIERARMTSDLIQRNKDLEQFTYIASHNLRAPLAAIMGLSDILQNNDVSGAERDEVLQHLRQSANNLDNVVLDMHAILHVREQINESRERIYFGKLVTEIMTSLSNTVAKENVVFTCDFAEAEYIYTLRGYLYSIFYQLSLNSIKYRQRGVAPRISIRSQRDVDKIRLIFSDNGRGIDMLKHGQNLFGLYKRFDTSVEGKGMGLFIVKTQVEALGGTVEVTSQAGQGMQIVIELPENVQPFTETRVI